MVPQISIIFMTIALVISVLLPFAVTVFLKRRHEIKLKPFMFGVLGFFIFSIVRMILSLSVNISNDNHIGIVIYNALSVGILTEGIRYLFILKLTDKKKAENKNGPALSYGIGLATAESIVVVAFALGMLLLLALAINNGTLESLGAAASVTSSETLLSDIEANLVNTPSSSYLVWGMDVVFSIGLNLAFSMLLYASVILDKLFLLPVSMLLYAIYTVPASMSPDVIKSSVHLIIIKILLFVVIIAAVAYLLYKCGLSEINKKEEKII